MYNFPFLFLNFPQLSFEFRILSQQAARDNLIVTTIFIFLLIQKNFLQILQFALNVIICLHHLCILLL